MAHPVNERGSLRTFSARPPTRGSERAPLMRSGSLVSVKNNSDINITISTVVVVVVVVVVVAAVAVVVVVVAVVVVVVRRSSSSSSSST